MIKEACEVAGSTGPARSQPRVIQMTWQDLLVTLPSPAAVGLLQAVANGLAADDPETAPPWGLPPPVEPPPGTWMRIRMGASPLIRAGDQTLSAALRVEISAAQAVGVDTAAAEQVLAQVPPKAVDLIEGTSVILMEASS